MRACRPAVTAGAVLLLLVLGISPVLGCDFPAPPPPAQAAEEADAVFVGTVTGVERAGDNDVVATFEVERVWRGPPTATNRVATPENPGMCGYAFEVGQAYLVYANQQDGELQTSIATRTIALDRAEQDLRALGEGEPPGPDPGHDLLAVVIVAAALALIATVGLGRRSRRSGTHGISESGSRDVR